MKTLYLECNMGAAGDMLMAALYELLPDQAGFLSVMNGLGLPGVRLEALSATTCGITGIRMAVTIDGAEEHCDHNHAHHHATPAHIGALIAALPLPAAVRQRTQLVYDAIAQAEGAVHGCAPGDVHFHEVGALDAVADVAGVCYAMALLAPEKIVVSPVHVGAGQVRCAHGLVPVPAPATAALLEGVPCYGGAIIGELCTPTGAALLAHFGGSFGPMPLMTLRKIGYGLGKKKFEAANCVRAFWGETADAENGEIVELVCNIDDMTAEALAFSCAQLLSLGALDVYTTAGTMKKGRPGAVLTLLCPPEREGAMARHILAQTTTNGLRVRRCGKYFLTPRTQQEETGFGPVTVKYAEGYGLCHRKVEYEDVARIAQAQNLPFAAVTGQIDRELNL